MLPSRNPYAARFNEFLESSDINSRWQFEYGVDFSNYEEMCKCMNWLQVLVLRWNTVGNNHPFQLGLVRRGYDWYITKIYPEGNHECIKYIAARNAGRQIFKLFMNIASKARGGEIKCQQIERTKTRISTKTSVSVT